MPGNAVVDVSVWYRVTEALSMHDIKEATLTLSTEEKERRDRFRFDNDRRDYTVAHDLLRRALSGYASECEPHKWQFESDAMGKPQLSRESKSGYGIEFNLSHTRGFVACAVSTVRVGIDVERIKPEMEFQDVAERCFSPSEIAALKELDASRRCGRFFELWTLKEAWLKATGCGLSGALDSFSFEWDGPAPRRFVPPPGVLAETWKFGLLAPTPEIRMTLTAECNGALRLALNGRDSSDHVSFF